MADNRYVMRSTDQGSVEIAMDVIATIVGIAALKVDGIGSIGGGITAANIEKQTAKALSKGIRISKNEEKIVVDIALNVKFGAEIMDVVPAAQEKVISTVEDMIGIAIDDVNIRIIGIEAPEEPQE